MLPIILTLKLSSHVASYGDAPAYNNWSRIPNSHVLNYSNYYDQLFIIRSAELNIVITLL